MVNPTLNLVDEVMRKNRTDLARQVSIVIKTFTRGRPMPETEVIATMAFLVGVGIGNQPATADKTELMRMAAFWVAEGEDAASHDKQKSAVDMNAIKLSQ